MWDVGSCGQFWPIRCKQSLQVEVVTFHLSLPHLGRHAGPGLGYGMENGCPGERPGPRAVSVEKEPVWVQVPRIEFRSHCSRRSPEERPHGALLLAGGGLQGKEEDGGLAFGACSLEETAEPL